MNENKQIEEYFDEFSENYDKENQKNYWKLCDEILLYHLKNRINRNKFTFADLGCGTGEWTTRILEEFPKTQGRLYDISEGMIRKCEQKMENYKERVEIIKSDIRKVQEKESVDIVFLLYVFMFNSKQEELLRIAKKMVKNGGKIYFVVENQLNGMAINILNDNFKEALRIYRDSYGMITESVPPIFYNTIDSIKDMCEKLGLEITYCIGFPVVTTIGVKRSCDLKYRKMKDILLRKDFYEEILQIEKN